ncbi:uncharacterized protein TNCV_5012091 [Trichonephila clavipes]|nr:uncharacterized protein TNCV_5012091 [Trichonephila clavipes]
MKTKWKISKFSNKGNNSFKKVRDAKNHKPTPHTRAALLDLSKAFDTVWNDKLIIKLHDSFNIRGSALVWIADFLHHRSIRVKFNSTYSDPFRLGQGVPQGSVLSPSLFSLFLAGIEKRKPDPVDIAIFADDIIIWMSDTDVTNVEMLLNTTLATFFDKQTHFDVPLKQLALEIISFIPKDAVQVYTDGSTENRTGSGIYIRTPHLDTTLKQRNPNTCSVFRSELIAINKGLDAILTYNINFGEFWILLDSRSALQHLSNWSSAVDETSISILLKLKKISQNHDAQLQWIPSHVNVSDNELADSLTKKRQ